MQFVSVPELGVPNAPPLTRFPDAVPVNAPTKVVAVTVPTTCSAVVGEIVPMPTRSELSTKIGVEAVAKPSNVRWSLNVPSLLSAHLKPVPLAVCRAEK